MADLGLFIGFGAPVQGRERQAIKVFNEVFENSRGCSRRARSKARAGSLEAHGGNSEVSSSCAVTRTNSRASVPARSSSGDVRASSSSRTLASWGQLWRAPHLSDVTVRGAGRESPSFTTSSAAKHSAGLKLNALCERPETGASPRSAMGATRARRPLGGVADVSAQEVRWRPFSLEARRARRAEQPGRRRSGWRKAHRPGGSSPLRWRSAWDPRAAASRLRW